MLDRANLLEELLEHDPSGEPIVALDLNEDVCLRSFYWARLGAGLPLPPAEEREISAGRNRRRWE